MSVVDDAARVESLSVLSRFRADFYECLPSRADTLFDLTDAVLCAEGPVTSLVELSLQSNFRRGHGALYDALAHGAIDEERLRSLLASQLPDGPLMFGVDASTYPRPSAECSPGRGHHYAPCRCDGDRKTVPGWQFQWITGLEWGSSSWTLPVDVARVPATFCSVAASAEQIRRVTHHLDHLGRLRSDGLPAPLFILDQGYSASGLTHALADVPVQLLVRIAGDRVYYDGRPGPRKPGPGRNGVHGHRFELSASVNLRRPDQMLVVPDTRRYGRVEVRAWHRMHQKVQRNGYFADQYPQLNTRLPVVEGTVIEVRVERLPDGRSPHRTMWLWHADPTGTPPDIEVLWRAYLRRFDMEHTFRLLKSELGWTAARLRTPAQALRWTWIVAVAYVQLRLARHLVADLRRPWEKPPRTGRGLSPHRVRRGYRHLRDRLGTPSRLPKTSTPGPGRPRGGKNTPAQRHPVVTKTVKTNTKKTKGRKEKA
ncbi:NF041680 family putative transposase [Streptomyces sp. NPDC056227]|uniref:NF041680 family putative transposase n=1 Tax=Streptomyces sp. NPDC056227 TaxID=3345753 RepID=UPI0035DEEE4E